MLPKRPPTIVLCLLGIAVNAFLFGPSLQITYRGSNDFMNFYSGTHLAFTDGMYDVPSNLQVMRETAGWENVNRLFNRPPFYALLLWPLGRLPFLAASHVWEILIVAAAIAFCLLWPGDRRRTVLACCWSFPLFHVFANGQDVAFLLVLIALAIRAMRSGKDTAAGLLFSLCSIKFHLFLLLPMLILRQRRWRVLRGMASGGAILGILSFVPGGWNWPANYLRLLLNPIGNPWPTRMPSIHGISANLPNSGLWEIVGIIAVVLLVWQAVSKSTFECGFAAVLVGGVLVARHAFLSDCAMALPALLITMPLRAAAWQRHLHFFMLSPACYLWALLGPAWITAVGLILYLVSMAVSSDTCIRPRETDDRSLSSVGTIALRTPIWMKIAIGAEPIVGQAIVFRGLGTWAAGPRAVMKNSYRFVGQAIVFCRLSYAARADFSIVSRPQRRVCFNPSAFFESVHRPEEKLIYP